MKRFSYLLLAHLLLVSCDDGDILVSSFNFDDSSLEICNGAKKNEFVAYKINSDVNEAISYNFISDAFSLSKETPTPITIKLDGETNILVYRKFTDKIDKSYFCNTIPPSGVSVIEELVIKEGNAIISTKIILEDDNDGVPAEDEDLNKDGDFTNDDTDQDGIPNFKDQDDDNDNILTSAELPNDIPDDDSPRDTDGDGIPDYLESDDDDDGIPTRNEDTNQNGNPRDDVNGDNIPDYRQKEATDTNIEMPASLNNTVKTTYQTIITINNIVIDGNNQNFEDDSFSFGTKETTKSIETKKE